MYSAKQNRLKSDLQSLIEIMYEKMFPSGLSWSEIIWMEERSNLSLFGLTAEMYFKSEESCICPADSSINLYLPFSSNRIGFLDFKVRPNKKDAYLIDIWVEEGYRQKSLGSKMIQVLASLSIKANIEKIVGELSPTDYAQRPQQINFYKKNGFAIHSPGTNKSPGKIIKTLAPKK